MATDSSRNPVEKLFEQFLAEKRLGTQPSIDEFAQLHPELAEEIRDLFPIMEMMETAGEEVGKTDDLPVDPNFQDRCLGDYRILHELGRGGMGVVYEAEHLSLGRRVALKILPRLMHNEKYEQRFLREARSAARLHHSNIVPVFDFGHDGDTYFYVMQYIDGVSLDQVLESIKILQNADELPVAAIPEKTLGPTALTERAGSTDRTTEEQPFSQRLRVDAIASDDSGSSKSVYWKHIAKLGIEISEALHYAHSEGILHRDIKPSNLILDERGNVWITDFGLAKADDELNPTESGDIVGTLRYMAPEVLEGRYDVRSDLCSLGLTLYELVALRPAFLENNRHGLIQQIANDSAPPLRSLRRGVPVDLETIIHKAIDRAPESRYASAKDVAEDLRRFLNDEPILARRLSVSKRIGRWAKKNKLVASLLALVATILIAVSIVSTIVAFQFNRLASSSALASSQANLERDKAISNLFQSRVSEAASRRQSRQPGQRFQGLAAIEEAVDLLPQVKAVGNVEALEEFQRNSHFDLRNEAIGCLGLIDVVNQTSFPYPHKTIGAFEFSSDLKFYAAEAAYGKPVTIHQSSDQIQLAEIPAVKRDIRKIQFFQHNNRIWIHDYENRVRVFHWRQNELIGEFVAHAVCLDSPGERLACFDPSRGIVLYSGSRFENEQVLFDFDYCHLMRFSPDGSKLLVVSYGGRICIFDLKTNAIAFRTTQVSRCRVIGWHPTKPIFATGNDLELLVWQLGIDYPVLRLRHSGVVDEIKFSPDGSVIATSTWAYDTRFWNSTTGEELMVISGELNRFSEDGNQVALASGTTLGIWKFARAKDKHHVAGNTLRSPSKRPLNLALHPNGQIAVMCMPSGLRVCDTHSGARKDILMPPALEAVFDPGGQFLISSHRNGVFRWPLVYDRDANLGICRIGPPLPICREPGDKYLDPRIQIDSTGTFLATAHHGFTRIYGLESNRLLRSFKPLANTIMVSISQHGELIAQGNHHGNHIRVIDGKTGAVVKHMSTPTHARAYLNGDGSLLAAVFSDRAEVYATDSWELLYRIDDVRVAWPTSFSPDGKILVLSLRQPKSILLVDAFTGRRLAMVPLDSEIIPRTTPAHVTPGGRHLVVVSGFNGIVRWNLDGIRKRLRDLDLDWGVESELPASTQNEMNWEFQVDPGADEFDNIRRAVSDVRTENSTEAAMEMLDLAIKQEPNNPRLYLAKASLFEEQAIYDDAIRLINRSIALDDSDYRAYYRRARLHEVQGRMREAIADLSRTLELNPQEIDAMFSYIQLQGALPAHERDLNGSLRFAQQRMTLKDDYRSYRCLGAANFYNQNYPQAIDAYEAARERSSHDSASSMMLAMSYHAVGEKEKSLTAYSRMEYLVAETRYVTNFRYGLLAPLRIESQKFLGLDPLSLSWSENRLQIAATELAWFASPHRGQMLVRKMSEMIADLEGPSEWLEDHCLMWTPKSPEAKVDFRIPIENAGEYAFSIGLSTSPSSGRLVFHLNGKKIGNTVECYSPGLELAHVDFGRVYFKHGINVVECAVIDKDPRSQSYHGGFERFAITK